MVKGIIFDWGGVLIEDPAGGVWAHCAQQMGVSLDQFRPVLREHMGRFQTGAISESDLWTKVAAELGVSRPMQDSLWLDAVRSEFREQEEVFQLISSLRNRGYKIAILSNTEVPVLSYFFDHHYADFFDAMVFSCVEHVVKPSPSIYQLAARRMNLAPEKLVYIDDKKAYADAAEGVGMRGIQFESVDQLAKDLRVLGVEW